MADMEQDDGKRFDAILFCRAPANHRAAVEKAAEQNLCSMSTYVRQAIDRALRADGFVAQRVA